MKNKIKFYILCLFIFFVHKNILNANEFIFDTNEINILEKGNIIIAEDGVAKSLKNNIEINARKFEYNKKLSTLNTKNATVDFFDDKIQIKSDLIQYNTIKLDLRALGNAQIKSFEDGIEINAYEDTEKWNENIRP